VAVRREHLGANLTRPAHVMSYYNRVPYSVVKRLVSPILVTSTSHLQDPTVRKDHLPRIVALAARRRRRGARRRRGVAERGWRW